jgi:hypothetical protein
MLQNFLQAITGLMKNARPLVILKVNRQLVWKFVHKCILAVFEKSSF